MYSKFKLAAIENKIMTEIAYYRASIAAGVAAKKTSFHKLHYLQQ